MDPQIKRDVAYVCFNRTHARVIDRCGDSLREIPASAFVGSKRKWGSEFRDYRRRVYDEREKIAAIEEEWLKFVNLAKKSLLDNGYFTSAPCKNVRI